MGAPPAAFAVARALLGLALVTSCGVAQVRDEPGRPSRHLFFGPHGAPLAYGGGVCPFEGAHTHTYPPVPRADFLVCTEGAGDDGARDRRTLYAFFDGHPQLRESCFLSGWHLHIEPPLLEVSPSSARQRHLHWDEDRAAYVTAEPGAERVHRCDGAPCAYRSEEVRCPDP